MFTVFNRLSNFFYHYTKGWLVLFILMMFILFVGISLPVISYFYPETMELKSMDDPVIYTPQELFMILDSWGENGRNQELVFHLTWDVIVPLLAFFLLGFSFSWLLQQGFKRDNPILKLNLIALVVVFDLMENLFIVILILQYPEKSYISAWLKTIFTSIKYGMGILLLIFLIFIIIKILTIRFKVKY